MQIHWDTLIIPDPNVRVLAVIVVLGIALMEFLIQRELDEKIAFSTLRPGTIGVWLFHCPPTPQ